MFPQTFIRTSLTWRQPALRCIQIWQYGQPNAAETGLDDAIAVAKQYGFDTLAVKALDGLDWMVAFDNHPDALRSLDQVAEQCARAHAAGLQYFVWTNPKHDVDVDAEAALTGQLALACDGLFLDTEPYRQFWNNDAPVGLAAHFMDVLRQTAPDALVILQPDPRPQALAGIKVDEWAPRCSGIAGQHYWTDFGSDPHAELAYAQQVGQRCGLPVYPTLPGNAAASSVPADLVAEFPGFVVWRLGTTGPAMLQVLGQIQPAAPAAAPEPVATAPARETPDDYPASSWRESAIAYRGALDVAVPQRDALSQQLYAAKAALAQEQTANSTQASTLASQVKLLTADRDRATADRNKAWARLQIIKNTVLAP